MRMRVLDYIRHREQGLRAHHRFEQVSLQQTLITHNEPKIEMIDSSRHCAPIQPVDTNNKAFLLVMSIDKSYFAVATANNSLGIYCSISGELLYRLIGSGAPIYTISWHPYFRNIISASNISGSVFIWDIFQHDTNSIDCQFIKTWNWNPSTSITHSIGFHPFKSIMIIARDREIRFIDWEKGNHIGEWRFFSEFSWVPWVSWSIVGSSIIVSVGNPRHDSPLNRIINLVEADHRTVLPVESGCLHYNSNTLCEVCDTCEKMSNLDISPPTFEEYRVNAVDLIRYVLSRPEDWFRSIFVCGHCRIRFKFWANSIQLHNQYNVENDLIRQKRQLPHDVESKSITIIESPFAPEVVWDLLQKLDSNSVCDAHVKEYIIPTSDTVLKAECKSLLRCISMFARECLRQSICWDCIKHIHDWVLQEKDFPLLLYQSMIAVRLMVVERVKHYEMNMFNGGNTTTDESNEDIQPIIECNTNEMNDYSELLTEENSSCNAKMQKNDSLETNEFTEDIEVVHRKSLSNCNSDSLEEPTCSRPWNVYKQNFKNSKNDRRKHLMFFQKTLKFLQFYITKASSTRDYIDMYIEYNLNSSEMLSSPSLNGSKIDSYSLRKWYLQPFGINSQRISPRSDFIESNVIVPCLTFSGTGLTESCIRMSKCGRTVAVFVPKDSFDRLHTSESSPLKSRKRRYSNVFCRSRTFNESSHISSNPVIAIYSSEPESSCGQLLYYYEMPYKPISLDFSPLGDHLIVGLSGSETQVYMFWLNSEFQPQSNNLLAVGPPSDSQCNIGLILKITGEENHTNSEHNSSSVGIPQKMQIQKIINHEKHIIYNGVQDRVKLSGPINCFIWNTAGGLLYSKEPGTLFSLTFVGCSG